MKLGTCRHCGSPLMQGALGCLGCGRLVDDVEAVDTKAFAQTQLGTQVRDALLDTRWRLIQPLGRGRTSTVWQAHDVPFDRKVVLKILDENLVSDAAAVARFEQDARRLAGIEHKNVVAVLALGRHNAVPFVAMRQAEGRSLAEHLHVRGGQLSGSEAALICAQLCEAFSAVHETGGPQGGLQPRQVFVAPDDGRVTLLEVHATKQDREDTAKLSERLEWVAPEVLSGQAPDVRSDLFTLGAIAWELVCGHAPPRPVPPPQPKGAALPADLRGAIVRATHESPAERFASAAELQEALAPFAALHEWASTRSGELQTGAFQALTPEAPAPIPRRRTRDDVAVQVSAKAVPGTEKSELERDTAPHDAPSAPSLSLIDDEAPTAAAVDLPGGGRRELSTRQFDAKLLEEERAKQAENWPERRERRRRATLAGLVVAGLAVLVLFTVSWDGSKVGPLPDEPVHGIDPLSPPALESRLAEPAPREVVERGEAFERQQQTPRSEKPGTLGHAAFKRVKPRTADYPGMNGFSELQVVVLYADKQVDSEVSIDGKAIGPSPVFQPVKPGGHWVRVDRRPLPPSEVQVQVPAAKSLRLEIELRPLEDFTQAGAAK